MKFTTILEKIGINPKEYIKIARKRAKDLGYKDYNQLKFVDYNDYKLEFRGIKFGNKNYKDYIIYLLTEGKEKAEQMRKAYIKRMFDKKTNITLKKKYTLFNW
jgi:hypothetical protein